MKNKELEQSIQLVRDGIQGLMKFLPSYLNENEWTRGVRYTFRPGGPFSDTFAKALAYMDSIEKIEKIDTGEGEFLDEVGLDFDGVQKYYGSIDGELKGLFE